MCVFGCNYSGPDECQRRPEAERCERLQAPEQGKSAMMAELAKAMGYEVIEIRLSRNFPGDLG